MKFCLLVNYYELNMKREQKWHFSWCEENKQKRNRGKQQTKPARTRRTDGSLGDERGRDHI